MVFRVLFVCTGNTCRSPMAEGLLRKLAREQFGGTLEAASAGTAGFDGLPASELAWEVAKEDGVDLSEFRSSPLDARRIEEADLILVMTPSHLEVVKRMDPGAAGRAHLLKDFDGTASGPDVSVPDPIGGSLEAYREAYRQIKEALLASIPRLRELSRGR